MCLRVFLGESDKSVFGCKHLLVSSLLVVAQQINVFAENHVNCCTRLHGNRHW